MRDASARLARLEGIRGFAACYVVLHHAVPHHLTVGGLEVGFLFRFGQEAVILFFLLSGFVITHAFLRGRDHSLRGYLLKRFARIYLPLAVVLLLGFTIDWVRSAGTAPVEWRTLLLNLLMVQDIGSLKPNVLAEPYKGNAPLWSLSYEWWFYMLFVAVQGWIARWPLRHGFVLGLAVMGAVVYLFYPVFLPRLLMYAAIWWTGVFCAEQYVSGIPFGLREVAPPLAALALIVVLLTLNAGRYLAAGNPPVVGVHPLLELRHHAFALLVVLLALAWRRANWVILDRLVLPFAFFAPLSYVMYISHHYFVNAGYLSFVGNSVVESTGYLLSLLLFSWVIEQVWYPRARRAFLERTLPSPRTTRLIIPR